MTGINGRRYYFAARYSRHGELRGYRDQLQAAVPDAIVTSRWIDCHDGELESSYTPEALAANPAACWQFGQHDLEDLSISDAIVSFTGDGGGGKGGRHIEHGVAIAYVDNHIWLSLGGESEREQFRLIVVGPRENIFHCHPATEVYDSWPLFLGHESLAAFHPGLAAGATP
jgi:hypothetical protein